MPLFEGVIDQSDEDIFDDVPDFHRQVKARLLKLGHTSQLIRETTLAPDQFLNRAGYPLRPAAGCRNRCMEYCYRPLLQNTGGAALETGAMCRPGVCYIGFVFKLIPNDPKEHACCAAQMFLNEGDAVVFRGANGPWKTGDYEFHLKKPEAKRLIPKYSTRSRTSMGRRRKNFSFTDEPPLTTRNGRPLRRRPPKAPMSSQ